MKRTALLVAAAFALSAGLAQAADKVTLQLKWVTQAQFAGYYVAADKGFYAEEGLEVEIKPGGPDIAPPQVLAGGGADVILDWMPSALATREKGLPLVNIAQPFKSSGMMLTCRKDTGITTPEDFRGKTIGVWFFGNEYPFLSWMSQLGIPTDGSEQGVTVLKQGFNVDPILQGQAACISTMTYNEYWQVIDAGLSADDLVVFKYEDQGVATLEDGIYVLESALDDAAFRDKMVRFVRASMKGWKWAEENPDDAADIVLENDATGAQTEKHQKRMMGEIAKLTAGSNGALVPADYERTVQTLLKGGSNPVITKAPREPGRTRLPTKPCNRAARGRASARSRLPRPGHRPQGPEALASWSGPFWARDRPSTVNAPWPGACPSPWRDCGRGPHRPFSAGLRAGEGPGTRQPGKRGRHRQRNSGAAAEDGVGSRVLRRQNLDDERDVFDGA